MENNIITLRKMIYDVKERVNAYSDDSNISDEHIAFLITQKRAKHTKYLISNLRKEISMDTFQTICFKMEAEDCNGEEGEGTVLKSNHPLPGIIETTGRSVLSQVKLDSRFTKWLNIVDYQRFPFLKYGRFIGKQLYVCVDEEGYLLMYNTLDSHIFVEDLKVKLIASDPEQADKLSCDDSEDSNCDFYDKKYPIDPFIIDTVLNEITEELTLKFRVPVDTLNNAEDDTANTGMQLTNRRQPRQQQVQQNQQVNE